MYALSSVEKATVTSQVVLVIAVRETTTSEVIGSIVSHFHTKSSVDIVAEVQIQFFEL